MELKDFIAATLTEIQAGVQAAIASTQASGTSGVINPCWGTVNDMGRHTFSSCSSISQSRLRQRLSKCWPVCRLSGRDQLGGGGAASTEKSNVSRIQFSIPVVPPVTVGCMPSTTSIPLAE